MDVQLDEVLEITLNFEVGYLFNNLYLLKCTVVECSIAKKLGFKFNDNEVKLKMNSSSILLNCFMENDEGRLKKVNVIAEKTHRNGSQIKTRDKRLFLSLLLDYWKKN